MSTSGYYSPRERSPYRVPYDQNHSFERSSTHQRDSTINKMPPRSRESSTSKGDGNDTINNAVKTTNPANLVPADLVAHITEQVTNSVMNRLKASGMNMATDGDGTEPPAQPRPMKPGRTRSPTNTAATSIPRQYTPPSPTAVSENTSHHSVSPDPALSEASSSSYMSNHNMSKAERQRSDTSPPRGDAARPKVARFPTTIHEPTILEKIWQPLFIDGQPTTRLSQFLRGLALHLINDTEPKGSLVVTPAKMSQFFREFAQPEELYPFPDIFGGRCTNVSISQLFRSLKCQHHFIQRSESDEPTIPALTTHGFATFMTVLIQADPDREYDRLAKAVLHMPISNADQPTERFPKDLSRRLFPKEDDRACAQRLYTAISADRNITLRTSNPAPPPPSQPSPVNMTFERERNPYHGTPSTSASAETSFTSGSSFSTAAPTSATVEDDDARPAQRPIERERQPYTAREGIGKIREDSHPEPSQQHEQQSRRSRDTQFTPSRPIRSNSTAPGSSNYARSSSTRPIDVPTPTGQRHHRASVTGARPNFNFASTSATSSAGIGSNSYTRSEGANLNDIPHEYYASNIHSDSRDPFDDSGRDDTRRYTRRGTFDAQSSSAGGATSSRTSMPPPRTSSQHSYDYPSGRDSRDVYDDRRRNMYPNGAAGGTDGYGSYSQSRY